jgi:hypothetical protein
MHLPFERPNFALFGAEQHPVMAQEQNESPPTGTVQPDTNQQGLANAPQHGHSFSMGQHTQGYSFANMGQGGVPQGYPFSQMAPMVPRGSMHAAQQGYPTMAEGFQSQGGTQQQYMTGPEYGFNPPLPSYRPVPTYLPAPLPPLYLAAPGNTAPLAAPADMDEIANLVCGLALMLMFR